LPAVVVLAFFLAFAFAFAFRVFERSPALLLPRVAMTRSPSKPYRFRSGAGRRVVSVGEFIL
jgi:hypothetical protein